MLRIEPVLPILRMLDKLFALSRLA